MELEKITEILLGQTGGVFALGLIVGGLAALRYVSPRIYMPQIVALQESVQSLELEILPYRKFKEEEAAQALADARRNR